MDTLDRFWNKIKRNPVIMAFLVAVATQVFQDWQNGAIDWGHFFGYIALVCIGVVARGFVIPTKDAETEIKHAAVRAYSKGRDETFKNLEGPK